MLEYFRDTVVAFAETGGAPRPGPSSFLFCAVKCRPV